VIAVQKLVDEGSDKAAAEKLGIAVSTVRALRGGLAVRPGTVALVQKRLGAP